MSEKISASMALRNFLRGGSASRSPTRTGRNAGASPGEVGGRRPMMGFGQSQFVRRPRQRPH